MTGDLLKCVLVGELIWLNREAHCNKSFLGMSESAAGSGLGPSEVRVVALTGGIASGKSSASQWLGSQDSDELRVKVIDADCIGHQAYADQEKQCYKRLVEHFGSGICNVDGSINRRELGGIVFKDPNEMKALQAIVWPEIADRLKREIESIKLEVTHKTLVVVEAAILLEAGWHEQIDFALILSTQVDPEVAKNRLMQRNNLDESDAQKRISSQLSNAERAARVSIVIPNDGTQEEFNATLAVIFSSSIAPLFSSH